MSEEKIRVTHDGTKHCGGDSGIVKHFVERMENPLIKNDLSVFESPRMAFAAEKSRCKNK